MHRREFKSPITAPIDSSGVVTSIVITGSRSTNFARFAASLTAYDRQDQEMRADADLDRQLQRPGHRASHDPRHRRSPRRGVARRVGAVNCIGIVGYALA